MCTAFFKHALGATLMAVSLAVAVAPAVALANASASAEPSAGAPSESSSGATSPGSAASSGGVSPSGSVAPTQGGAAPVQSPSHTRAIATWYGPGLYGHTTACGQKLTPKLVGLASRTLPCGTLVHVSYHGHQLTAPVLDRGPFGHNGAKWDLTAGAARALEITETVRIATAVVGSLPNSPSLGEPSLAAAPEPTPAPAAGGAVAGGTTAG